MEITLVLGSLTSGGTERVASLLIHKWISLGYSVELITRRGPEADFYTVPGTVKRTVLGGEGDTGNFISALLSNILYVWKLRGALKASEGKTIVSFLTKQNIYTLLASIGLRRKVIISERNDTTRQLHPWPWLWLRKKLYRRADWVTANIILSVEEMRNYVPGHKLIYLPNPIRIPEKYSKPEDSAIILTVGRLVKTKNHSLLLEAFSNLVKSFPGWEVKILGEGELWDVLNRTIQNNKLQDSVMLMGLVENPNEYYQNAAFFVLPSLFEGTPNAMLEAMANGLPVIISNSLEGAIEWIDEGVNGLVFRSNDKHDLEQKMRYLIENPNVRTKMGRQARQKVKSLDIQNVINDWNQLL